MTKPGECLDLDPHPRHTWGWPVRRCPGIRHEDARDLVVALRMAMLAHDEEIRIRQQYEMVLGIYTIGAHLTWDVLPWRIREEKTEAMLAVVQTLNGTLHRRALREDEQQEQVLDISEALKVNRRRVPHSAGGSRRSPTPRTAGGAR